jgi:DNA-binding IclR family transcriptional regulator
MKIYRLIEAGKGTKISEISETSGIPDRTVRRILAKLIEKGHIQRIGENRSGKWILIG